MISSPLSSSSSASRTVIFRATETERRYWTRYTLGQKRGATHLGFPRRAAWCRALNPSLFVRVMSAAWSNNRAKMSSRFLEIASWRGVSPSASWKPRNKGFSLENSFLVLLRGFPFFSPPSQESIIEDKRASLSLSLHKSLHSSSLRETRNEEKNWSIV